MKNYEKDLNSSDDEYHQDYEDHKDRHQRHKSSEKDNSAKQIQQTKVAQDPSASKQYLQFFHELNHEINHPQQYECNQLQTNITSQMQSEKFFNYLNHLQGNLIEQLRANDFIVANTSSQIESHTDNPRIQFQFKILRHIPSLEVVQLLCKLGKFSKTFTVLNNFYDNSQKKIKYQTLKQPNKQKRQDLPLFRYSKLRSFGSYSNVYDLQFLKQRFIIKRVSFKGSQKLPFHAILKQIFIASMMSALRIGPKIKRINGFDFCVNSECVEFLMQECKILGYPSQKDEQDLKICLLKMHALKMCHIDIKPHNLMFSVEHKKAVLIDFGISQLLQKRVGNKTKTHYNGTVQFSSPQMSKLFNGSFDFVDLYLNDIFGLRLSLKRMNQKIKQKQTSQIQNKQNHDESMFHKRSHLELIREQSEITYKQATTNKLLFNQLLKRVIETLRFIKNEQLQQNFNQYHSKQFLSQYSQELKSSFLNQLLAQLTKCLVYKYRVQYLDNYTGQEMYDSEFISIIKKFNALESIGDQLNYFQKLLNRQFLEQSQKYFTITQPSLFYYNFFDREKTLQIKNFYHSRIIESQTNQSQSQKFSSNSQSQKLNFLQQLNILSDENKVKSEFFSNNNKQIEFIDILVQHLKFTNFQNITILDKLQIVQNLKKKTFQEFVNIYLKKTSQNCQLFKYFLGLTNSLNEISNSQKVIQFCVNLPFQHQKNKRLTPIFQVYQRILNIILYSEKKRQKNIQLYKSNKIYLNRFNQPDPIFSSLLKESQQNMSKDSKKPSYILDEYSKLDQALIKQLKFHLPDIIKSMIFLGFNYYNWLKPLLMVLVRQIVQRKHLKRHFTLCCLKQFLQIGVISDNFHTFIEQKQIKGRLHINLKYDLFNPKAFEDLKQSLKKQILILCLDEKFQMDKIQIISNLWIFFNYQLVKLSLTQDKLIDIFSQFMSSLNKQFSQLSSQQQFEYYPLYKQVMESIKDYSLIKYVKVLTEYWRNSALIQGSHQTYRKLWNFNQKMYQSKSQKIESNQILKLNQKNTKELSNLDKENILSTFQLPPPLNYYVLTDPIHYDFQKQPVRHKVAQQSLIPIDGHFISNELTLYLHLPIRAEFLLNKKSLKQFEQILFKVCNSKINNFHNIKTILKFVDLLVDFINQNKNEKTDLRLNEIIQLLWTQCIKIIDSVKVRSSESQDALERQYLHLTYGEILNRIKVLFTLMLSNNSNINLKKLTKFQVLAIYDPIINILHSYQSYHQENINIRIFNGYIEHQLLSLIKKGYPQILFYKETRIIEILSNIQADFIEINERKIMADKLVQKEVTQNIEESVMSKELWGLLLQIIFVQILPLTKELNYQNSIALIKNIYQQQKHFTQNQEQLAVHCTINVLRSCLFYNVNNLKEFWKVFLFYLETFVCNQKKMQKLALIGQLNLKQILIQQTFSIFWLFSRSISQNMKSQILGILFQLMKGKKYINLRLLTYVFILIQQKAYFSKELSQQQQGIKNLKIICNILLKTPFQNKKRRFFEQFYINSILLDVSINKQKSSKVRFLIKKLIKNLQEQSPYNRNSLKYVIQQYLQNGLEQNNQKKRKTSSQQQIIKLHSSKRLRYFNTMVKTNNINKEDYFDNNQKAMLHRSQNYLKSMNNNKAVAQLNSLIYNATEGENRRKQKQKMQSEEQKIQIKGEMISKQKQNSNQKQLTLENKQQREKQKQSFNIETEPSEQVQNLSKGVQNLSRKAQKLKANFVFNFQTPRQNSWLHEKVYRIHSVIKPMLMNSIYQQKYNTLHSNVDFISWR